MKTFKVSCHNHNRNLNRNLLWPAWPWAEEKGLRLRLRLRLGFGFGYAGLGRVVMLMMVCGVAGCMSTPEKRIKEEPGIFAAFPPEIQAKVQRGEVEVGFTRDMVRLALGLPQRVKTRVTEAGQTDIWLYTSVRTVSHFEPVDTGYWYRDRAGRMRRSYDMMWLDRGYSEEYPVLRLEFSDNKVKAIERMKR